MRLGGLHLGGPAPERSVLGELASGLDEFMGGLQQRLRRDAADIETGAAEAPALLDAGDLHAELRRPDRRDIAAWPTTENDQVEGSLGHSWAPFGLSQKHCQWVFDELFKGGQELCADGAVDGPVIAR